MCDEINCDSCCDGCDHDCCCCSPFTTTLSPQHESGATPGCEHDCLFYLCCAGCFLCPIFYVGFIKRAEEPIMTPVDTAAATRNDNATVAAMTLESTNVPESKLLNIDLPITVTIDPEKLNASSIEHDNDSIESTPPIDRK